MVRDGEIQRKNKTDGTITFIRFDTYSLDSATFSPAVSAGYRPKDQPTGYLLAPDVNDGDYQSRPERYAQELHRRFSDPLYPLAMVMVALFFTANARSNRQEAGAALILAGLTAFGARAIGFVITGNIGGSSIMTVLAYGFPFATIVLYGGLLFSGYRIDGLARMVLDIGNRATAFAARFRPSPKVSP
ncbi:MAG: LptF/LptG family permease [Phyllobacteriaceae bacterium]|nr:LptF/LptG family permease [Phyllobacteriaceae bacterium]